MRQRELMATYIVVRRALLKLTTKQSFSHSSAQRQTWSDIHLRYYLYSFICIIHFRYPSFLLVLHYSGCHASSVVLYRNVKHPRTVY